MVVGRRVERVDIGYSIQMLKGLAARFFGLVLGAAVIVIWHSKRLL